MRSLEMTEALVIHLESVLKRLERENKDPFQSCCACLQDVDTAGHLPSCILNQALKEIQTWRSGEEA
jgi:hypothetical protein